MGHSSGGPGPQGAARLQEPMTPGPRSPPTEPPVPTADAARLVTHLAQARPASAALSKQANWRRKSPWCGASSRRARTHAVSLSSPRFGPAARFFLSDVYAPRDFSQRDADLQRFYEGVRKVLPERAVAVLADVIDLSALTNELDDRLVRALVDELGVTDAITLEQYAAAYRLCDNYDQRRRQLHLIEEMAAASTAWSRFPSSPSPFGWPTRRRCWPVGPTPRVSGARPSST